MNNRKMSELSKYKMILRMNPSLENRVISAMVREARGKVKTASNSQINAPMRELTMANTPASTTIQLTSALMKTIEMVINPGWKIDSLKETTSVTIICGTRIPMETAYK